MRSRCQEKAATLMVKSITVARIQTTGPKDIMKVAPGSRGMNQEFEQLQHGYHSYDLLHDSRGLRFDDSPALDRAECEVWLDGRRTRGDIAGKDKDGNVLWVIEIMRSGLSRLAIDRAQEKGIPMFVVDLTQLPHPTEDDPWAETKVLELLPSCGESGWRVLSVRRRVIQHGVRTKGVRNGARRSQLVKVVRLRSPRPKRSAAMKGVLIV